MSRILDDIAKAEKRRRESGIGIPGFANQAGANDRKESISGSADWQSMTGSSSLLETAANGKLSAERKRPRWYYGAGLVVAMVAGMSLDRYLVQQALPVRPRQVRANVVVSQPKPASPVLAAAPRRPHLPACIPLDAEDFGYGSKHPGWQRYRTESVEFRVFRKQDSIKAIQVMARQGESLNGGFLDTFLGQVAGKTFYKITSREKRDGYLIEKGSLGRLADVAIYRRKPANEIRALVVVYLPV